MPKGSRRVEQCVEDLCKTGCSRVHLYIELLQKGEIFPEVAHLSAQERRNVLAQLVTIMKVYSGRICDS